MTRSSRGGAGSDTDLDVAGYATQSADLSTEFGLKDQWWEDCQWSHLLESLVADGFLTWKEIAALTLGHLNPPQVGTSLASSEGFKRRYGKGNTMAVVLDWVYKQNGRCVDCESRLELQADHIEGREKYADPLDADFIGNMALRCRRCNVIKRPSHEYGGQTFLTAESALMWILLEIRPRTLVDFVRLCRIYGMTMADIRMQEAWAMTHWLSADAMGGWVIADAQNDQFDVLKWKNGSITRVDACDAIPDDADRLYSAVDGDSRLAFLALDEQNRRKLYSYPMEFISFSSYDLGGMPPYSLAVRYSAPQRERGVPQKLSALAPCGMEIVSHVMLGANDVLALATEGVGKRARVLKEPKTPLGKFLPAALQRTNCRLLAQAP